MDAFGDTRFERGDAELLAMCNELLGTLHVGRRLKKLSDINSSFFITLYEGLCAEPVKDVIKNVKTVEDEIHNCQAVIDSLSLDVLNTPLSHITGQDIVAGDPSAIENLVEIFYGLTEYILEDITSAASTDGLTQQSDAEESGETDPDRINRDIVNGALNSHLQSARRNDESIENALYRISLSSGQDVVGDERVVTAAPVSISAPLPSFASTSAITPVVSTSSQQTAGSTMSTVRPIISTASVTSPLEILNSPPSRTSNRFDLVGMRPTNIQDNRMDSVTSQNEEPERILTNYGRHIDYIPLTGSSNFLKESKYDMLRPASTSDVAGRYPHAVAKGISTNNSSIKIPTAGDSSVSGPASVYSHLDQLIRETMDLSSSSLGHSGNDRQPASDQQKHSSPYSRTSKSCSVLPTAHGRSIDFRRTHPSPSNVRSVRFETSGSPLSATASNRFDMSSTAYPTTFQEYRCKYYGSEKNRHRLSTDNRESDRKSRRDEDEQYLSDSCVDYDKISNPRGASSGDTSTNSFSRELDACKQQLKRKSKVVRFDDYLDDRAVGNMGQLRRQFKVEDQNARMKTEFLKKVYSDDLKDLVDRSKTELNGFNKSAAETEAHFKKLVLKKPQTARFRTTKYSGTSVLSARSRPVRCPKNVRDRKRSASASPVSSHRRPNKCLDDDLFPWLLEEFPYLHLAPATLHNLWHKASVQLEQMSRIETGAQRQKSKAQEQIDEASKRQQLLVDILLKEQQHRDRLNETRKRQQLQVVSRNQLRDKRLQSARVRRYYEDFQVRQRSRMLKKRTKEELVFKRLFNDGLDIQKRRIRELQKYAKEQRVERAKRQQLELEAIENFYKDRFALIAESMEREKKDIKIREKAQSKVLEHMKHELRKKMEKEIGDFQRRMWQDEDDVYYRELDAERVKHQLHVAQYQGKV